MKNKKGITLISLSVTVSVLVILAGVTISTAVGENGFIEQIKRAKERTEQEVSQGTANIENTKINDYKTADGVIEKQDSTAPLIVDFKSEVSGGYIVLSVTATDAESGIKKIEYSLDDGQTWENTGNEKKPATYKFKKISGKNSYKAMVKVTNEAGLESNRSLTIDLTN